MARPTARDLALRDPALAAIVGAIPGSNFGAARAEADFGGDLSGEDDLGVEFGDDVDFGAARRGGPSQAQLHALWLKHSAQAAHSQRRAMLLEPNKGSTSKIGRYSFSINQSLVLGTASAVSASGQPDTNIRPQRVQMNAPSAGFVTISEMKVANVSVTVGGTADAIEYSATAVDSHLDMPTLTPANRATVLGSYTGFVPPSYVAASAYLFTISFKGPASVIA